MKETRLLYITIITLLIVLGIKIGSLEYKLGIARGQLKVLQDFKNIYMPASPAYEPRETE